MGRPEHDALQLAIENLSSPWDLSCVSLGIAIAGATATWSGGSADQLLPVGAFGALALRKGWQALMTRSRLRRRAIAVDAAISRASDVLRDHLRSILAMDRELWERRAISDDRFSFQLDELLERVHEELLDWTRQELLKDTKRLRDQLPELQQQVDTIRDNIEALTSGALKKDMPVKPPYQPVQG